VIQWFDSETTGLDPQKASILEVASIITDDKLNILDEFEAVIQTSQLTLDLMNDWCRENHGRSGLTKLALESQYTLRDVQAALCERAVHFTDGKRKPVLAGSSIHFDRMMIKSDMPFFDAVLDYRMIDVSAIAEAFKRFHGIERKNPNAPMHRAMPDIRASLDYYKWLMSFVKAT
jgi:oligoribonuclease